MNILLVGFISAIFILINISEYHVTDGQFAADVTRHFVPIKFDSINRGLWNATDCLTNLLNCWELVKADILCSYTKYKTTICGFWRDNCHDFYGRLDGTYGGEYTLFEGYCFSDGYQTWT
ncbi:hypothetical protein PYW07_011173 [Mythimna separata]|uniref:Uncharacterized protein n=1 Tax=Mythimna separata TaxID=271217 RepID=A0AAD8DL23_MYTSE|nr:hypothetical protein PYW07_011173 [Mythimna separata]